MRRQDSHAPDEALEQYSLGTLPEEEAELLEEHLLICQGCRDRLEETDGYVEATRRAALALELEPPSFWDRMRRGRWLWRPLPAAAAIAAVAAVCWLAWPDAKRWGAPAAVLLQATRGDPAAGPSAPASRPLVLMLDVAGVPASPAYHVDVVDRTGASMAAGAARRTGDQLAFRSEPLRAGRYWVRVYGSGRELLREYGLEVK